MLSTASTADRRRTLGLVMAAAEPSGTVETKADVVTEMNRTQAQAEPLLRPPGLESCCIR